MYSIFLTTFREILRNKFFGFIIFLGVMFFGSSVILNTLALNQPQFIIIDFWLSFIELALLGIILVLGNRLLSKEFEEKTIYLTLSRPIERFHILLGKYFWFLAVLTIAFLIFVTIYLLLLIFLGVWIHVSVFVALGGIYISMAIILAVMLLFSVFLTSSVATFATLAVYIIWHSWYTLLEFSENSNNTLLLLFGKCILFLFPNLEILNYKHIAHAMMLPAMESIAINYIFGIAYVVAIMLVAIVLFSKKRFDNI